MAKTLGQFKPAQAPLGSRRGRSSSYGEVFTRFNSLKMDEGFEDTLVIGSDEDVKSAQASLRNSLHRHAKMQQPSLGASVGFDSPTQVGNDQHVRYTVYKVAARPARPRKEGSKPAGRPKGSGTPAAKSANKR